ncbi:MAG TPA: beta-propeller fold lactonase family protein [Burkholderiales bacterium]|nr:beta-propeller fold lactonase family protein [Burkholderiales bacterium]
MTLILPAPLHEGGVMANKRHVLAVTIGLGAAIGVGLVSMEPVAGPQKAERRLVAPTFKVDPFWPKPLPDNWVTGEPGGTCIDSQDHLIIVTRGFQTGGLASPEGVGGADTNTGTLGGAFKSKASPPVIEFDTEGNVVRAWGNPALVPAGTIGPAGNNIGGQNAVLPNSIHGCFVDYQDNIWIGGNGDGVVQKYSHDGTLLMQIGTKFVCDDGLGGAIPCTGTGGGNVMRTGTSHTLLSLPADIAVDPANGEIYIADGYGNHRVVVFDANGHYLRQMGTVGSGDGQFTAGGGGHPHCVVLARNGYVYACDRGQDRINIYTKGSGTTAGTFVKAIPIVPGTAALGTAGSAWDVDFSPDAVQTFMYESDGGNEIMWILDHAAALKGNPPAGVPNPAILAGFGRPGHMAGEFTFLHMMAIDSSGNLYVGETVGGRRVQKFVNCGRDKHDDRGRGNGRGPRGCGDDD